MRALDNNTEKHGQFPPKIWNFVWGLVTDFFNGPFFSHLLTDVISTPYRTDGNYNRLCKEKRGQCNEEIRHSFLFSYFQIGENLK